MSHLASVETDYSIIYPFLVFLYNSMARREELRVFFVTESPCHGLNTFVRIFCSLKEAESSDSSDESDKAKVQEWVTRLLVLLMTNYDGDLSSYEEDKVSLFEQLIMAFPKEERSNVLYFYKQIVTLNLEEKKATPGEDRSDTSNTVCRDILPRHLMKSMLAV